MPIRFDYAPFKAKKTDEGFLIDSPIVARTGILEYRNADGSIRKELRLPEDVFNVDSLASFAGKPITVNHPKKPVNSKNVSMVSVGTILAGHKNDNDTVSADIVIHRPDEIGDNRQLSLGYDVDLEETPGEWQNQKYDAIQRNIRVNHLSVVKSARAGPIARLNLDSNEIIEVDNSELINMSKIRLDNGIEYDAAPEVVAEFNKIRNDFEAANKKLNTTATQLDTVSGERDTLKKRVDGISKEIETAVNEAKTKMNTDAKELVAVEKIATSYKVDCKDLSLEQIKIAVIKAFNSDFSEENKSTDYINAAFSVIPENKAKMNNQRQAINNPERKDESDKKDPREEYINSLGKK